LLSEKLIYVNERIAIHAWINEKNHEHRQQAKQLKLKTRVANPPAWLIEVIDEY